MERIALNGEAGEGKFALVDDEDFPLLNRIRWNITDHGYAVAATTAKMYMHVLIFGLKTGPHGTVDHQNRDRLDNQKSNLRLATKQRQMMNQGKRKRPASSIYKGVCKRSVTCKLRKPWQSSISVTRDGVQKTHFLGYYADEVSAAKAYDIAAQRLFGEYCCLNFPSASVV